MTTLTQVITAGQKPVAKTVSLNPDDPGFRYKIKQLLVQVIGKGKMIKSHFLNLEECAKSIDADINPEHIIAFIGYELGAKWDYKTDKVAYISGDLTTKLEGLFKQYLDSLVICSFCGYPELRIENKDVLQVNCKSCGKKEEPQLNSKMIKKISANL